jgi:formylglycine-generating enzyme required for sulfatase activity
MLGRRPVVTCCSHVARLATFVVVAALSGCRCEGGPTPTGEPDAMPSWDVGAKSQPARAGMVWIPPGVLLAGTKPGQLPRVADEELPGTPMELEGFFIDVYNYPAEPGAIPETGLTQARARIICEEQGKRLCTELEWERACKGPDNHTYDYGPNYDASTCGTGTTDALAPNGVNTRCVSGFGVRDTHGSAWNWTSSAWRRGDDAGGRVAVRGGNGEDGELIGRCANGRGLTPDSEDPSVGVRCCAGKANAARVALQVERGSELAYRPHDPRIAEQLEALVPEEIQAAVKQRPAADHFSVDRLWMWRPIGNEELVVGGGCAHPPVHDACGVIVARLHEGRAESVAFVSSDWWIPTVGEHEDSRTLFVYGGDIGGAFRKPMVYAWGRIREGDKHRKKRGGWTSPLQ